MLGQALADGVFAGATIALGAVGLSLVMQILRFANFAHAELLTWGAYSALLMVLAIPQPVPFSPLTFGWTLVIGILVAIVATSVLAIMGDVLIFKPLRARRANSLTIVFATFGISLIIRNLILLLGGPDAKYYSREFAMAREILPNIRVTPDQIAILVATVVLVFALSLFLRLTRTGIAMRGIAENPTLSRLCGVSVERIIRWTWFVAASFASAAGVFLGLTSQIRPEMGFSLLLSMFTAVILGGVGSLVGAVIGAFIIGTVESVSALIISTGYREAISFLVLVIVLYFRPQGLFGTKRRGE